MVYLGVFIVRCVVGLKVVEMMKRNAVASASLVSIRVVLWIVLLWDRNNRSTKSHELLEPNAHEF